MLARNRWRGNPESGRQSDRTAGPDRRSIRNWPEDERPREKVLRSGVRALSEAELLAIVLRSGTGTASALDIARELLACQGGLHALGERNAEELMRVRGIGAAKAAGIVAALELGRRVQASNGNGRIVLRAPEDVGRRMVPLLRDRRTVAFVVLILRSDNSLKEEIELTSGTLNASLVHPREVFKAAIDHGAASIIVVHNHPSGNPEPSAEDLQITRQLAEAGKIVGIPLRDHLIVAGGGYTSLAERGVL